jgi:protein SCO1/2
MSTDEQSLPSETLPTDLTEISQKQRPGLGTWLALGFAVLLVIAALAWAVPRLRPYRFHGSVIQSPNTAADFTLFTRGDVPVSLHDFRGKLVVLYFGYTFCPDVCPTTMAHLAQAMDILGNKADKIQVIMVSVDPERDTPEYIQEYVEHFDKRFLGVTSDPDTIAQIAALYGIYYQKHEGTAESGYIVDHTATVLVIDKKGYLKLLIPYGTTSKEIASDLSYMLRH